MKKLEKITVYRLAVPLAKPYQLAFGVVERYDTLIVETIDNDGRLGLGEATVLTGYTDETIDDCWREALRISREITGSRLPAASTRLAALSHSHPFTATAFATALEMMQGSPLLNPAQALRVPLVGLLDGKDEATLASETERLLAEGYRTLKFKVGFAPQADAARVAMVQRAVRGRARIRIDANQGYSAQQALVFLRGIDPQDIELFEQPCRAGDWDAHLEVAKTAAVPLMLDESIYGLADIDKAAALQCAAYIKVKLMKLVTLDALVQAIARIRELGMQPVLGNGVACDLGCWMEACVAAKHIDNAGEMNGFLKTPLGVLRQPPAFRGGSLLLEPGYAAVLDPDHVARHRIDAATFTAGANCSTT